jgi:polysaccharide pyruvyl transferase WcaK-like protein
LDNHDIDYVGTRLHAGIRALQKKRRAIIIAIDNRAIEKQKDFNLTIINRDKIDYLKDKILSSFNTDIRIPVSNIDLWKKQFVEKVINKNED